MANIKEGTDFGSVIKFNPDGSLYIPPRIKIPRLSSPRKVRQPVRAHSRERLYNMEIKEEDKPKIIFDFKAGLSTLDLKHKYRYWHKAIKRFLRSERLLRTKIRGGLRGIDISEEDKERIISDYKSGIGIIPLIKKYHYRQDTISTFLRGQNLVKRAFYDESDPEFKKKFTELWLNNNNKREDIAKRMNLSIPTVYRLSREYNLPERHGGVNLAIPDLEKKIKRLYLGSPDAGIRRHSTFEIADILGIHDETVRGYLIRMGIERRTPNPHHYTREEIARQNQVIYLMSKKGYYREDIAKKLKREGLPLGKKGLDIRLRQLGLLGKAKPIHPREKRLREAIYNQLFNTRTNLEALGKEYNVASDTIRAWLKEDNLYERYKRMPIVRLVPRSYKPNPKIIEKYNTIVSWIFERPERTIADASRHFDMADASVHKIVKQRKLLHQYYIKVNKPGKAKIHA
jgi:hypothetical protein